MLARSPNKHLQLSNKAHVWNAAVCGLLVSPFKVPNQGLEEMAPSVKHQLHRHEDPSLEHQPHMKCQAWPDPSGTLE